MANLQTNDLWSSAGENQGGGGRGWGLVHLWFLTRALLSECLGKGGGYPSLHATGDGCSMLLPLESQPDHVRRWFVEVGLYTQKSPLPCLQWILMPPPEGWGGGTEVRGGGGESW